MEADDGSDGIEALLEEMIAVQRERVLALGRRLAPELAPDRAVATVPVQANRAAGSVTGVVQTSTVTVTGQLGASWDSGGASSFQAVALNVTAATVRDGQGNVVGSGAASLTSFRTIPVLVSGNVHYDVTGRGDLSFYGPAASSLGVGALWDTPIINKPQVAILGPGTVVKRPVVIDDPNLGETIAVRYMVYLALTYDHRLVDGADAGRFLQDVKKRLEAGSFEV